MCLSCLKLQSLSSCTLRSCPAIKRPAQHVPKQCKILSLVAVLSCPVVQATLKLLCRSHGKSLDWPDKAMVHVVSKAAHVLDLAMIWQPLTTKIQSLLACWIGACIVMSHTKPMQGRQSAMQSRADHHQPPSLLSQMTEHDMAFVAFMIPVELKRLMQGEESAQDLNPCSHHWRWQVLRSMSTAEPDYSHLLQWMNKCPHLSMPRPQCEGTIRKSNENAPAVTQKVCAVGSCLHNNLVLHVEILALQIKRSMAACSRAWSLKG